MHDNHRIQNAPVCLIVFNASVLLSKICLPQSDVPITATPPLIFLRLYINIFFYKMQAKSAFSLRLVCF